MMKYFIGICVAGIVTVLGLEIMFQFLPVNSGIRMAATTSEKPYARYLAQQPFVYSHGWAMGNRQAAITNTHGFNNSKDFSSDANFLVIGDSFIESFMLPYADTVQGQLDNARGKVYAAAASGNGLADALQLARQFLPITGAKTVVIFVEPFDILGIDQPSNRGHNFFTFSQSGVAIAHNNYVEASAKARVLRSALLRYLNYNLKLFDWLRTTYADEEQVLGNSAMDERQHRRNLALDYFMDELKKLQRKHNTNFVFLVDGDREEIYGTGEINPSWNKRVRSEFLSKIQQSGFDLIDMHPVFTDHWKRYRERMDFLPNDGHWNKVAHKLAASEILKYRR